MKIAEQTAELARKDAERERAEAREAEAVAARESAEAKQAEQEALREKAEADAAAANASKERAEADLAMYEAELIDMKASMASLKTDKQIVEDQLAAEKKKTAAGKGAEDSTNALVDELRAQLAAAKSEASQAIARAESTERLASASLGGGAGDAKLQQQVVELSQEVALEASRARKAEEELARTMASFVEATRARLELQRRVEVLHEKLEAESARCKQMVVHSAEISEYFAIVCKKAGSIAVPLLEDGDKA